LGAICNLFALKNGEINLKLHFLYPMTIDISKLDQTQIVWYAKLVVTAVLADDEIAPSEVKFVKDILKFIDDKAAQAKLIQLLEQKKMPPFLEQPPAGLDKFQLAEVLTQLIEICISDLELIVREEELLKKISVVFDFQEMYTRELIAWGKDGLETKGFQQKLISKRINDEYFFVPLQKLDTEQKKWYVDVIVAALISEGAKEEREVALLKKLFHSSDSKEEQLMLRNHVMMKHRPPLKRPPKMHEQLLMMIFMEVIQIATTKGDLSYQGGQLLKNVADLSRMPTKSYTDLMDWCGRLVSWKQKGKKLIAGVRLNTSLEDQEAQSKGLLVRHPKVNSIQVRQVKCFVCGHTEAFDFYQIRHLSQQPAENVFKVPGFFQANEGFDQFDFNKIRVAVCPHCYFASTSKTQFSVPGKEKTPPELANPELRQQWVEQKDKRADRFGDRLPELKGINRSLPTVIQAYELAVDAALAIAHSTEAEIWELQVINLRLIQAELLMSSADVETAHQRLKDAMLVAERLFVKSRDNLTSYRCARLLLVCALYFQDERKQGVYYDFFIQFKSDKYSYLSNEDKAIFNRYETETKGIWDRREQYAQQELKGFHLKKFKKSPGTKPKA